MPAKPSKAASEYRALLYIFSIAGVLLLFLAYKGSKGLFTPAMGVTIAVLGLLCFMTGAWYGWRGAKIRLEEQNKRAEAVALITLAAFLKDKSDEELEKAIAKGGPAGEAARLVQERRRNGLRASRPVAVPPEAS